MSTNFENEIIPGIHDALITTLSEDEFSSEIAKKISEHAILVEYKINFNDEQERDNLTTISTVEDMRLNITGYKITYYDIRKAVIVAGGVLGAAISSIAGGLTNGLLDIASVLAALNSLSTLLEMKTSLSEECAIIVLCLFHDKPMETSKLRENFFRIFPGTQNAANKSKDLDYLFDQAIRDLTLINIIKFDAHGISLQDKVLIR